MKKLSPRDRQNNPDVSGPERIDPEHTNRAGTLSKWTPRDPDDREIDVPLFSVDQMLGIAARTLAKSFRKPKRKYRS